MQKLKPVEPAQPKVKRKTNQFKIMVDFSDMQQLYNDLITSAKMNFRTPEEQVLYCVWKQTNPESE